MPEKSQKQMIIEIYETMGRLDERTNNIYMMTERQEKHLAQINGSVGELQQADISLMTTVYGKKSDKGLCGEVSNIKKILWGLIIILVSTGGIGVAQANGLLHLFGG